MHKPSAVPLPLPVKERMTGDMNSNASHSPVTLPELLRPLFWDAEWNNVDSERNLDFIIERVLSLGNDEQLSWLRKNIPCEAIRRVVMKSRRLSRKTARCWQNYFGLREEEMQCFGMFSTNPDNLF